MKEVWTVEELQARRDHLQAIVDDIDAELKKTQLNPGQDVIMLTKTDTRPQKYRRYYSRC